VKGKTLEHIQSALLSGQLSVVDLASYYLANAKEMEAYNAFLELYEEEILEAANKQDARIKEDPSGLGKLFGCVVSIKDNICYKGHTVSAASKMLEDYVSPYSATVVERLLEEDALIIGRTNCDEFSMGSAGNFSAFGAVKNAIDPNRIAGGSSAGAAVSCYKDACLIAVGSDTGGSVRQPAAYNGVIGFKPSYGMLSRWGLIAYASSLDQIGLMAKNAKDISCVMACIAGEDAYDSTSLEYDTSRYGDSEYQDKPRVARLKSFFTREYLSQEMLEASDNYFKALKGRGHDIVDVEIDFSELLIPCYYIICTAEAASNLARYDGVRYGYSSRDQFDDYKSWIKQSRTEALGQEVKKRIILGNYVLSEGHRDAYFLKALKLREYIKSKTRQLLNDHDFLFLPVTSGAARESKTMSGNELEIYEGDIFTVWANLTGQCSINLPIQNKVGEMPLSIQIMGKGLKDPSLLAFAGSLIS